MRTLNPDAATPDAKPLKDVLAPWSCAGGVDSVNRADYSTGRAAYGFNAKKDLLALNLEVAAKIEKGEPVTAPGVPRGYPKPQSLITDDCIRPAT